METRVAVISIIVEQSSEKAVDMLNSILHEYSQYIIGRMGLPYAKKNINIISVVIDAPQDCVSALSGKLGRIEGLSVTSMYSKS